MIPAIELTPPVRRTDAWVASGIAVTVCLAAVVALYWGTVVPMVALWQRAAFSHGFLVLPAALYLAWERRADLGSLEPSPAFMAVPALALASFIWLLGSLTNTGIVEHFCLVTLLVGFVWGVLGTAAARRLALPLAFLFFAVPAGERLIPTLQDFTARFAVRLLAVTGVPVLLEGHVIAIPGSRWEVAQACSGISYLFASVAIGFLYAGAVYRLWKHRVAFVLASAIVPLVANGVRVYTVILLASLGATGVASGIEHYLYGWMFFSTILILLYVTCGRWKEEPRDVGAAACARAADTAGTRVRPSSRTGTIAFAALALLVVAIAPAAARTLRLPSSPDVTPDMSLTAPAVSLPWRPIDHRPYDWSPHFTSPGGEVVQSYESAGHPVMLYAAAYGARQPDVKLVSVSNVLFDRAWWAAEHGSTAVTIGGERLRVQATRLKSSQGSLLVWNWYVVDGVLSGNDYFAKGLLAKARLFRSALGSSAIAVATEDDPRLDPSAVLMDFVGHLSLAHLPGMPSGGTD